MKTKIIVSRSDAAAEPPRLGEQEISGTVEMTKALLTPREAVSDSGTRNGGFAAEIKRDNEEKNGTDGGEVAESSRSVDSRVDNTNKKNGTGTDYRASPIFREQ